MEGIIIVSVAALAGFIYFLIAHKNTQHHSK
jgi:hypothetical protein